MILAGGSGTRLWPSSRKSYPKQFVPLMGDETLFQQTALRLTSSSEIDFTPPVTLTNANFRFIIAAQLQSVGIDPGAILIEPEGRNTAPAILAACIYALSDDENATLLVCPSDHLIPDKQAFHLTIMKGIAAIDEGYLVTFGVKPSRPETGYGYLEVIKQDNAKYYPLKQFVEKPNAFLAKKMFEQDQFLWNSGIFMMRAGDMVAAFQKHCPELLTTVRTAMQDAYADLGFLRIGAKSWSQCSDISIDYAIMEKASNIKAVPFDGEWSDLGDWNAIWEVSQPDKNGVVTSENATAINCQNVLLRSENKSQQIVGLGLSDIVAVAMPDAVLVIHKNEAQNVKKIVNLLNEKDIPQAEVLPKDYRPWGWFETLVIDGRYQVKRILVNPGAKLSLQSHEFRSEHWIVVKGKVQVTIDDKVKSISEGESVYVPLRSVHRMENLEDIPMILIEVQTGSYLGEDDILRYDDIYCRD